MLTKGTGISEWQLLCKSVFEVGGQDQFEKIRQEFPQEPADDEAKKKLGGRLDKALQDTHIRVGTLLKTDSVSFLLGAGASREAGGVLLGTIPPEVEHRLLLEGVSDKKVQGWLKLFYLALWHIGTGGDKVPQEEKQILVRYLELTDDSNAAKALKVNFESVLSLLYRWRSVIQKGGSKLKIEGRLGIDATLTDLDECLRLAKGALIECCVLPVPKHAGEASQVFRNFLKKILTRPLNLKRANVFTLNYDTLIEQAADAEGVVLLDGFVGSVRRVFRPESYDQDLYFPADTTEGRVHRLDRVLHLYKLHGSIDWCPDEPDWDNPYGVSIPHGPNPRPYSALIYPTPLKYAEALGMPYSELFRRFASAIVRPQSTLFVLGYGFGDEHVNAIIRQALAIPSFTLVIVEPNPSEPSASGSFMGKLRARNDLRVWLIAGEELGKLSAFVNLVLPDLRDEEILRKVMATHRALGKKDDSTDSGDTLDAG